MKTLRNSAFACFIVLAIVMATITLLDKITGVEGTSQKAYGSLPFVLLWAVTTFLALLYIVRAKLWRMPATMMIHASFLVILCGALTTHIFGQQGTMTINPAMPTNVFVMNSGDEIARLPFTVVLDKFNTEFYDGTTSPKDYVSHFVIDDAGNKVKGTVSMNNVFTYRNYRFYQSGYGQAMVRLSIAHDPYGIAITYTGYVLLLVSMFLFFFQKESRFRKLLSAKSAYVMLALWLVPVAVSAGEPRIAPKEVAEDFGNLHIYYNGRICPVQTYAYQFTTKLCGSGTYRGRTAEEVLCGWIFFPDTWKEEPMIKIKGNAVKRLLGTDSKRVAIYDFANDYGEYLLADAISDIAQGDKVEGRSDILDADDKVGIVNDLFTGESLRIFPIRRGDGTIEWYSPADTLPRDLDYRRTMIVRRLMSQIGESIATRHYSRARKLIAQIASYQRSECGAALPSDARFKAEKIYNKISSSRMWAMGCLTLGLLLFLYSIRCVAKRHGHHGIVRTAAMAAIILTWIYLTACLALRAYISRHIPVSNGYETMQFLAWCCLLLTLAIRRRYLFALPFGFIVSGLALLVATIGQSNPAVTNLVPVLQSPLLSVHVMVIMIAYALLAFIMLNGIAALVLMRTSGSDFGLQRISLLMLYPAVFLLTTGIFIGAVWANVSWGRYWGWDAKEVWALITLMIYSLPLHSRSLPFLNSPRAFHTFGIVAFLTVLMTYFGVNFILGGLHSYA